VNRNPLPNNRFRRAGHRSFSPGPAITPANKKKEPAALNRRHGLEGRYANKNRNWRYEVSYYRAGCNAG
jgi:hypothetical protein